MVSVCMLQEHSFQVTEYTQCLLISIGIQGNYRASVNQTCISLTGSNGKSCDHHFCTDWHGSCSQDQVIAFQIQNVCTLLC